MRVVFLGAPGAGKGTQASRAAQAFGLTHLATGDMLREAIAEGSPLGKRVEGIVKSGALVDDQTIIELIGARIENLDKFILDGFPRTLAQADALRAMLGEKNKPLDAVVLFNVDEDALVARIAERAKAEGRSDDRAETFRKRLETYASETAPLIAFYRAEGLIYPVDGMASIDQVADAVQAILGKQGINSV